MAEEPDVVAHLRAAVDADPANAALRLHLATALVDVDPTDALAHTQRVLAEMPDDAAAITLAARAADAAGRSELAERYRRLLAGLGEAVAVPAQATAGIGLDSPAVEADEFDAFLRELVADDARDRITLDDVAGLEDAKSHLETTFLGPMRRPELRQRFGTDLRGGLLLYGPPGCGKTFLARAVAGELGARFLSIGLHEVLDMWLGRSERNLHAVFTEARRVRPSVLFLDEIDALGQRRAHLSHSAGRNVVVQLLTELDSMAADNHDVFVLAATNAPWDLDPALRRPGRLDRSLLVLPPDADARARLFRSHLHDRPVTEQVDPDALAARTDGWSGADIALVCDRAARSALARSSGLDDVSAIDPDDLERAIADQRPSTRAWFEEARSHVLFANQSGEFDELLAWMRAHRLA